MHTSTLGLHLKTWSLIACCTFLLLHSGQAQTFSELNNQFLALFEKGKFAEALPVGEKALAQSKKEFGIQHVNYAIAADNLANTHLQLQHYPPAIQYFQLAIKAYTAAVGDPEIVEVGICHNSIGTAFLNLKHYDSARHYYAKAYYYFKGYPKDQYANLSAVSLNYLTVCSQMGDNKEVEEVSAFMLPVIADNEGKKTTAYYEMLSHYATSLRDLQKMPEAAIALEEFEKLSAQLYGQNSSEHAAALNYLGDHYRNMARFAEAEKTLQQSQAILQTLKPADIALTAANYHARANLLGDLAQFEKSYALYDSALQLLTKAQFTQDELYTTIMRSYAYTSVDGGKFPQARKWLTQVQTQYEKSYGKDYIVLGEVFITQANISFQLNELATAQQQVRHAMQIIENGAGPDNFLMSRGYEIEGLILHKMGKSIEGLALCKKAARMNATILGEYHAATASSLSNVGLILQETGDYAKAEEVLRQSFQIRQKVYGTMHPQTAISMGNLATVLMAQARYGDADKLLAACIEILRSSQMLNSPLAITMINNVALMSQQQGQTEVAKKLYLQLLQTMDTDRTVYAMIYGTVINNLAIISLNEKKYDESVSYSNQAMEYASKTQGKNSIPYIKAGNNLLVAYSKLHQYDAGKKIAEELLAICKKTLGDSAQLMGTIYSNYSSLESGMGHLEKAAALMYQSLSIQLAHYEQNLYALSERDQVAWWQDQAYAFQLLPALLMASSKTDTALVAATVNQQLQLKGLVLYNATAALKKARNIQDPDLQLYIDAWQSTRTLYLQQSSLPQAQRNFNLDSLQIMSNNYEQAIHQKAGNQLLARQSTVSWQQVQQALGANEAAVEFIRYPGFANNQYSGKLQFGAIVIRKNGPPQMVPLGTEAAVQWCFSGGNPENKEAHIQQLYRSKITGKVKNNSSFTGDSLYRLVWQPLLPYLQQINTVSFAPDGLLHKIAFAALPNGDGTLLLDSFQLQQYSSVRQIVFRENKSLTIHKVFVEGNAAFNAGNTQNSNPVWPDLPGTKKELQMLKQIFSRKGIQLLAYDSLQATEDHFKAISNEAPTLIHIATHGFFLPDPPMDTTAMQPIDNGDVFLANAADPLLRSGIILAGANKNWNSRQISNAAEDGIVTAYEIAQLNLSGTQLAVLSACETGLGDVQDAEGVFGLQRALKMAGIRNLVLSLWEVPDEETMELMTLFYNHLLTGKPTRQAFYEAQLAMRQKYPPFAWSAFVLME